MSDMSAFALLLPSNPVYMANEKEKALAVEK